MFGLGMPEILLLMAIALMVIGPKKLPDLAKTLGRAMGEFKKAAQDFKRSIDMEETVKQFEEPTKTVRETISEITDPLGKKKNSDSKKETQADPNMTSDKDQSIKAQSDEVHPVKNDSATNLSDAVKPDADQDKSKDELHTEEHQEDKETPQPQTSAKDGADK